MDSREVVRDFQRRFDSPLSDIGWIKMLFGTAKRVLQLILFRPNSTWPIMLGTLRGIKFKVSDVTGLSPLYSGGERYIQQCLRQIVRPNDTAIDIGANWGLHTLYLAKLVGAHGRVVACEPFPAVFQELEWHLNLNNLQNTTALPIALGNSDSLRYFQMGHSPTTGRLLDQRSVRNVGSDTSMVTTKKLDTLV